MKHSRNHEKRRNPETKTTNKKLEEIETEADDLRRNTDLEKKKAAYKQSVTNKKVSLHGNLRVDEKNKEAVRVLGLNINSLSI